MNRRKSYYVIRDSHMYQTAYIELPFEEEGWDSMVMSKFTNCAQGQRSRHVLVAAVSWTEPHSYQPRHLGRHSRDFKALC